MDTNNVCPEESEELLLLLVCIGQAIVDVSRTTGPEMLT